MDYVCHQVKRKLSSLQRLRMWEDGRILPLVVESEEQLCTLQLTSACTPPSALGRKQTKSNVRLWPILLKKSTMVSTTEKYALEIEIFTLNRGFRVQISRSGARKRRFQRSVCEQSGSTDFFNRIGRFLPVVKGRDRTNASWLWLSWRKCQVMTNRQQGAHQLGRQHQESRLYPDSGCRAPLQALMQPIATP